MTAVESVIPPPTGGAVAECKHEFRNYVNSERQSTVEKFYHDKNKSATLASARAALRDFEARDPKPLTIWEAMAILDTVVDDSDPDTDAPQTAHAFQTGEAARKAHPDTPWLHLVGFIHDVGKILCAPAFGALPQWQVVGDIFPVGCPFSTHNVFPQYFAENPDTAVPEINASPCGIYSPGCGFENVTFSWGHDEYLYRVLLRTPGVKLPKEALHVVRFHSFYPWHSKGAYSELANDFDREALTVLKAFQKCDLYSKQPVREDAEALHNYYDGLIKEFLPEKLLF